MAYPIRPFYEPHNPHSESAPLCHDDFKGVQVLSSSSIFGYVEDARCVRRGADPLDAYHTIRQGFRDMNENGRLVHYLMRNGIRFNVHRPYRTGETMWIIIAIPNEHFDAAAKFIQNPPSDEPSLHDHDSA